MGEGLRSSPRPDGEAVHGVHVTHPSASPVRASKQAKRHTTGTRFGKQPPTVSAPLTVGFFASTGRPYQEFALSPSNVFIVVENCVNVLHFGASTGPGPQSPTPGALASELLPLG